MRHNSTGTKRLALDAAAFEANQRLVMYEIVNTHLAIFMDIQRVLDLKPDTCQIFITIAISSVQRYARSPDTSEFAGTTPLPEGKLSAISRRQLSACTGIPRETVARHVRQLIERGLIVEARRGQLQTPPGLLNDIGPSGLPDRIAQETTRMANVLTRLGVLQPRG